MSRAATLEAARRILNAEAAARGLDTSDTDAYVATVIRIVEEQRTAPPPSRSAKIDKALARFLSVHRQLTLEYPYSAVLWPNETRSEIFEMTVTKISQEMRAHLCDAPTREHAAKVFDSVMERFVHLAEQCRLDWSGQSLCRAVCMLRDELSGWQHARKAHFDDRVLVVDTVIPPPRPEPFVLLDTVIVPGREFAVPDLDYAWTYVRNPGFGARKVRVKLNHEVYTWR